MAQLCVLSMRLKACMEQALEFPKLDILQNIQQVSFVYLISSNEW